MNGGPAPGREEPACGPARATRRGPAGFTLIEVLVSLIVAVVGVMGVAALLQRTLDRSGEALDAAAAESVLRDRVAALRAVPYGALRSGSDVVGAGAVYFRRDWRVRQGDPVPGMKRIEVTVRWTEEAPLLASEVNEVTGLVGDLLSDPTSLADLPERVRALLDQGGRSRRAVLYRADG